MEKNNNQSISHQKKKRRKVIIISVAVVLVVIIAAALAIMKSNGIFDSKNKLIDDPEMNIVKINRRLIRVNQKEISMHSDIEGEAILEIEMPDYAQLFHDAYISDDPEKYISEKMQSGESNMVKHERTAVVTVDDGKKIVHTDETVNLLLEEELIKAINALMEDGR